MAEVWLSLVRCWQGVDEVWVRCEWGVGEVWKRRGTVRLRMSLQKTGLGLCSDLHVHKYVRMYPPVRQG